MSVTDKTASRPPGHGDHIIDRLIEERAPRLVARPRLWAAFRRLVAPSLNYAKAVEMCDAVAGLDGAAAMDRLAGIMDLDIEVSGLENIPESGPVFLVGNHPTGLADGFALWSAAAPRRPDLAFLANRDAIRAVPGLADLMIPVQWRHSERSTATTRQTLMGVARMVKAGRAVAIFPSGRIAYLSPRGLTERPWEHTVVRLARKFRVPVVPFRLHGRNSALFYGLSQISTELRDVTLFREMLNKRGHAVPIAFGAPIPPEAFDRGDLDALTERLKQHVLQEVEDGRPFRPERGSGAGRD